MGGILCYFNKDWCDVQNASQRRNSSRRHSAKKSSPKPPSPSPIKKHSEMFRNQLERAFPTLGIQILESPNSSPIEPTEYHISPKKLPFANNIRRGSTLKHRPKSPQRNTRKSHGKH